ncbi:MAG: hypothetical protein A3J55_03685 [Candidatus Ryanbacteria bacterium RIFCSPHIGHO2_02_FULL_45_17b]|nr:MAG: hypothetical protein A3J55_03685 [Candidatus Ryanbacteria bacterium RIFCSPHIGHO2_02_FULL_45_17b]
MNIYYKNKGTALFLTGVIISIALAVGIGVSTISFRELRITRTILPSFQAFYAADAGVECAYYWDDQDPSLSKYGPTQTSNFSITCLGEDDLDTNNIDVTYSVGGVGNLTRIYTFDTMELDNGNCVDVTVQVRENVTDTNGNVFPRCLRIDSFGGNACVSGGVKVQRGLLWKDPVECPDVF